MSRNCVSFFPEDDEMKRIRTVVAWINTKAPDYLRKSLARPHRHEVTVSALGIAGLMTFVESCEDMMEGDD